MGESIAEKPGRENAGAAALVQAVSARICHDLAGQLGTLAGMIALAEEEHPGDESLALAARTASEMVARLRFLRAAWAGGAGALTAAEVAALAAGLPGAARLRLEVRGVLPEDAARLALSVLPVGAVRVAATSDRIVAECAAGAAPADDGSVRAVPLRVLRVLAAGLGWAFRTEGAVLVMEKEGVLF